MFYHSITEFVFLMNILGKRSDLPFSRKSDRKKEKSTVSFTHEQNIICSQTQLDGIAHEQTIICRQLFAGHVVDFRPIKRRENLHRMIINNLFFFPRMRLYTTVILEALFMVYLLRDYLCFLFFSPQSFFFTGSVVLSYAAAFIVSVCVEFPMMQLEKLIFKTQR